MAPLGSKAPLPPAEPQVPTRVFSPQDEEGYEQFFHENGFVVVAPVLESERIDATVDELWASRSLLGGHPGLKREEPATWDTNRWPAGCRNFLDPLDPCAEVESWRNRLHPSLARVFSVIWRRLPLGTDIAPSEETHLDGAELVVSVDRFGVMRPTRLQKPGTDQLVEKPEWRTSRNWLHWDQNPWTCSGFFSVQGLVALTEGTATSGGCVTVPGFHREFARWAEAHPEGSIPKRTATMVPFPVPLDDEMQDRRVKVLVPRGGLLVWDSRMPHESYPNEDTSWRLAQYVTYKRLPQEALSRRAAAWHAGVRAGLVPAEFVRRFTPKELAWLGAAATPEDEIRLSEALEAAARLSPEELNAAAQLRRAYRLKQTAEAPEELKEAAELFRAAFATNPDLKEPLRRVAAAEDSYLPFWIL